MVFSFRNIPLVFEVILILSGTKSYYVQYIYISLVTKIKLRYNTYMKTFVSNLSQQFGFPLFFKTSSRGLKVIF